jgi:hypothetical protein
MAKFRTNHSRQTRGRSATVVRLGVIAFLFFAGLLGYLWVSGGGWTDLFATPLPRPRPPEYRFHLSKAKSGQFWIHYPYHSVLIDSAERSPLLGTSLLDVRLLKGNVAECEDQYLIDPSYSIKAPSSDSSYHLIAPLLLPSSDSSGLCFYSNLTELPLDQEEHWKKLQAISLNWVRDAGQIYLVTGHIPDSSAHFWVGLDLRSNPHLASGSMAGSNRPDQLDVGR